MRADVEDVSAGAGRDLVVGNDSPNVLDGGDGDDDVTGGGGADTLFGGAGIDVLRARDGLAERVECNANGGSAIVDTNDTVLGCSPVDASDELIADVDGDGATKPADCDDHNAGIRPGATDVPENGIDDDCDGVDARITDRDGDGFSPPQDCNDANPAIRPSTSEVVGNSVDENCDGIVAPFPRLTNEVRNQFAAFRRYSLVRVLAVRSVVPGMRVQVRCRGRGCPYRRRTIKVTAASRLLRLDRPFRHRRLRAGTVLQVRILQDRTIGKVVRFTIRLRNLPRTATLCLPPGARRPTRC